jgi:CD109 antigen
MRGILTMSCLYEGVTNTFQTPYLLSLVNMPRMIAELEVNANQTFVLPLQQIWTFIPGSASSKITVTGDVCGPFFYLGYDNLIYTDNSIKKSFAPVEAGVFTFGTMIYNLMYMRQGHGGKIFRLENVLKILEWINYEYMRILTTYNSLGYFTQYGNEGTESIWLSSWVITVLKDAVDPVWEQYSLFIDPELLNRTIVWLISHQNPINGSWGEIGPVYDRKFQSNYTRDWDGSMVQLNLTLTAQCVIALKANSDIRGYAAKLITNSINKGRLYLEQHLPKITDAFELSIVTYALHVTNSPIKDIAFQRLNNTKWKNDYGVYWSNFEIPKMRIYWPSKNPRQNWKPESNHEAYAVAATAYALLTHLNRAERYNKYEIMTWLQSQRNFIGGMSSTYDTLIAHKALVLYAIGTGDAIQNYNMNIRFTSSSSNDLEVNYLNINDSNIIDMQAYDINNVWGNVLVDGQGTGFALLQMKVQWNVEYPWLIRKAPYEPFNISLQTIMYGRNFSHIDYHVCLTWLPNNSAILNSNRSGHAQFEIQIPTGYRCEERYLKTLIGDVRNLGDAENMPGQLNFLFDYIDTDPICFSFTLMRYIPVANISRYYGMNVFEYHEPNNANRSMYNLRDLFGLDICEVCGSYQCPYCPYYAHAFRSNQLSLFLGSICLLFVGLLNRPY